MKVKKLKKLLNGMDKNSEVLIFSDGIMFDLSHMEIAGCDDCFGDFPVLVTGTEVELR